MMSLFMSASSVFSIIANERRFAMDWKRATESRFLRVRSVFLPLGFCPTWNGFTRHRLSHCGRPWPKMEAGRCISTLQGNGRGTLLVAYAGWRGWVLGAWKIPTERAEAILPRLQEVVEGFGPPCAIMRYLGRAMSEAAQSLVEQHQPLIPVLACHRKR